MRKHFAVLFGLILTCALHLAAQERPTILVQPFTLASGVAWPYDMKQLRAQTVAEIQNLDAKRFVIVPDSAANPAGSYLTLRVEILEWQPGNAAKRALVGMGSGRESAKLRIELTDANGKKLFEHEDTIRTEFYASAYTSSVGQLAHPMADKIGKRIAEAKLD